MPSLTLLWQQGGREGGGGGPVDSRDDQGTVPFHPGSVRRHSNKQEQEIVSHLSKYL